MLILKHLPISGNKIKIAYIHRNCPLIKTNDIGQFAEVEVQSENKSVYAHLQIISDDTLLNQGEIGLNDEAFNELSSKEGKNLNVSIAVPPLSLEALTKKIGGNVLNSAEYERIIDDIGKGRFSPIQATAFLLSFQNMLTDHELAAIAGALINRKVLNHKNYNHVVSFASLNNSESCKAEIIASMIAAAADIHVIQPMAESRRLPFTKTELTSNEIKKLLTADKVIFFNKTTLAENKTEEILEQIHKHIGINQNYLTIASLMATSVSFGISDLLLELPVGKSAVIKTYNEAIRLRSAIEILGDLMGISVETSFIEEAEPLGNNFGLVFEAEEISKVLNNETDAAKDLRERSLFLAGKMLNSVHGYGEKSYDIAAEILNSGKAAEIFEKVAQNQGLLLNKEREPLRRDVLAAYDGLVSEIDCKIIKQIVAYAGKTENIGAGLVMNKKVGDTVKSGEVLYTLYSVNSLDFDAANALIERNNGFQISLN